MSYNDNRISEQLRVLEPAINQFINRYNASSGPAGGGNRQTVFLFPGGMASRLVRAKTAWDPAGPSKQVFAYDEVWLNALTFLGGARNLKMTKAAPNEYHDKDKRIIVADGLINLFGVTPYLGFTAWCALKGLDYFVFPCDWRRSAYDLGDLFISHFLPRFQQMVKAGCNSADPLTNFSVIGHSSGGMVANWTLRSGAPILSGLDHVITVATPFYGYGGQLHRWFEGEKYLNGLGGVFTQDIIKAICSFPGCYEWMFLPEEIFLVEQAAFALDLKYPLMPYPSVDFTNPAVIADPYNPQIVGGKGRYPSGTGFDYVELASAKALVMFLASPLSQVQADKFWNIRADKGAGQTRHETTWKWVPPSSETTIRDVSFIPGDGVQPAWTARHVHLEELAPSHVINITSQWADHQVIMNLPVTLQEIAAILGVPFL